MQPIKTEDQNALLQLEGGTEANDLPCKVEDGWTISTWKPSEDELAALEEHRAVFVWLWWPNLIGVRLHVQDHPDEAGSDETMKFSGIEIAPDGHSSYNLGKPLSDEEIASLNDGAPFILQVNMHPTCPVALAVADGDTASE